MNVILLNGTKEVRTRNSEGCTVLPCGCAHTDTVWLQMCEPHHKECMDFKEASRIAHQATLRAGTDASMED